MARFGEFVAEAAADDATTPFKLLQDSVARDIFIPCGLELRADDCLDDAAALFRRTRLPAFPVVDAKGEAGGTSHRAMRFVRRSASGSPRRSPTPCPST